MSQSPSAINLLDPQDEVPSENGLNTFQRMQLAVQFVGVMSAVEKSKRYERLMLIAMLHVNRLEEISKMTGRDIGKLISSMPVGHEG